MTATIALAMVGRNVVSFSVMQQWIHALRKVHWPGPDFTMPEIYSAGAWIGVVPLRNLCTYKALQDKSWDYLLWIDADHVIHHSLFERLEEHAQRGLAIVGGCYFARTFPFEVQAFGERQKGGVKYVSPQILAPIFSAGWPAGVEPAGLLPVAGVGTGCMLIRRDVLERMAVAKGHPMNIWRADRVPPEEQLRLIEAGESISGVMTEDILFCLDVKDELGEQTWLDVDPRMETGHVGEEPRDRRHWLSAHTIPERVILDPAAIKRQGYEIVNTDRERTRRLRR